MGVQVRVVVYALGEEKAAQACREAFRRMAELEDIFSDYRPTSELMRLCARAGGPPVPVSEELFFVLQRAQELAQSTQGAFDVTVGPFVRLWRRIRRGEPWPSEEEWQEARRRVGWWKMRLHPETRGVELTVPGMQLDLGGIAKGYILDQALAVLRREGVSCALIEAGGDIVVGDAPPGREGWRIEVAYAEPSWRWVTLANAALSTSGDTEQFVEINGVRYSHIVDPRTGWGVSHRIAATVIAPDGITSDSLATALCVLGEEGLPWVRTLPGVRVYLRRVQEEAPRGSSCPRRQKGLRWRHQEPGAREVRSPWSGNWVRWLWIRPNGWGPSMPTSASCPTTSNGWRWRTSG